MGGRGWLLDTVDDFFANSWGEGCNPRALCTDRWCVSDGKGSWKHFIFPLISFLRIVINRNFAHLVHSVDFSSLYYINSIVRSISGSVSFFIFDFIWRTIRDRDIAVFIL